jgi:hypothetical protein
MRPENQTVVSTLIYFHNHNSAKTATAVIHQCHSSVQYPLVQCCLVHVVTQRGAVAYLRTPHSAASDLHHGLELAESSFSFCLQRPRWSLRGS